MKFRHVVTGVVGVWAAVLVGLLLFLNRGAAYSVADGSAKLQVRVASNEPVEKIELATVNGDPNPEWRGHAELRRRATAVTRGADKPVELQVWANRRFDGWGREVGYDWQRWLAVWVTHAGGRESFALAEVPDPRAADSLTVEVK